MMNQLNKELINHSANSLTESTTTSWSSGDLEEWSSWAKRMRSTIQSVTPVLTTIANNLDTKQDKTIDAEDVAHLKWLYYRLSEVHGENPGLDYMVRMKKIIDKLG